MAIILSSSLHVSPTLQRNIFRELVTRMMLNSLAVVTRRAPPVAGLGKQRGS